MGRPAPAFERGELLDRYRLQTLLGQGAFGEVWLAAEMGGLGGFERKVAVKLITSVTDRRIDALLHEAKLCSRIDHPNVVEVYDVVQCDGAHFIVMEYVEGEDIARLFKDFRQRGLRLPNSVVLDIGIGVCEALNAAWLAEDDDGTELKIVHRDLKPHNVLFGAHGVIKVADFGIAKAAPDVTMTSTGVLKGTPTYAPPEIWMGSRDFSPATDLYGVGVMLWELVVGRRFYDTSSIAEVIDIMGCRTPDEEADAVRDRFPELADLLPMLLDRSPDDRVDDSGEVAQTLRDLKDAIGALASVDGGAPADPDILRLVEGAGVAAAEASREAVAFDALDVAAGIARALGDVEATRRIGEKIGELG